MSESVSQEHVSTQVVVDRDAVKKCFERSVYAKKTVRLPLAISQEIDKKDKPAVFLRQSIINQVEKEQNTKTKITVEVKLANTQHYSDEFSVRFSLSGNACFKEQIGEFIDAVQNLQKAITRLDP